MLPNETTLDCGGPVRSVTRMSLDRRLRRCPESSGPGAASTFATGGEFILTTMVIDVHVFEPSQGTRQNRCRETRWRTIIPAQQRLTMLRSSSFTMIWPARCIAQRHSRVGGVQRFVFRCETTVADRRACGCYIPSAENAEGHVVQSEKFTGSQAPKVCAPD